MWIDNPTKVFASCLYHLQKNVIASFLMVEIPIKPIKVFYFFQVFSFMFELYPS